MSSPQNENKMGVMPVNKLLLSMSIPMMLSMLVQALYNVVDSVFVSRISEDALNAVSLAFPIQNLMIAVSVGTGVGINAQLSRYLGSKDQKHADATAVNGLFVSIISLLVMPHSPGEPIKQNSCREASSAKRPRTKLEEQPPVPAPITTASYLLAAVDPSC